MPIYGFKVAKKGRSIQGGGYYGNWESQSIRGGGYVSGITAYWLFDDADGWTGSNSIIGLYLKANAAPSGDTVIFDWNFGVNGYFRARLTSSLHIISEMAVTGLAAHTVDAYAGPITTGQWYWLSTAFESGDHGSGGIPMYLVAQVWGPGGVTPGAQGSSFGVGYPGRTASYVGVLGWGVAESSTWSHWPNSVGWELSKMELKQQQGGDVRVGGFDNAHLLGPPGSDPGAGGLDALYLCRDALGTTSGIVDSTGNAFNLTPGPNGLLVVSDGPYA